MNPIQKAAFLLDLPGLKSQHIDKENLHGALLAACSAHDAEPRKQIAIIRFLKSKGADVNEMDNTSKMKNSG